MGILDKIRSKKHIVRAAVYARFSSDNQRDESIDAQLRAIKDYAKKNDIIIVAEYIDRAKSAMTDNRPEFLRMIQDSKEGQFDVVLVHKLDRFARNRQDSIGYRMELKRHGVSLVSVLEYLDEESPESIILESVLEAMAEYYSKNLSREVRKGMNENAIKGLHTGGLPPLGYDVDPETKKLVINEKEADAVRLIFKMFNEGNGYIKIIKELNRQGYKTKTGRSFGKNSLHNIIRNEKYIGVYVFNKLVSKDMDGKRNGNAYKPDDEIIRIEGAVPPIITKEEFEMAKRKIERRKGVRACNRAKEIYLLSGKIFCGECGHVYAGNKKMTGRNKKLHVTYRCTGRQMKHICPNKEIRREYIEAFVLDMLAQYVFDEKIIPKIAAEYKKYQVNKNADIVRTRDNLSKRLNELKKEINNLVGLVTKTGSAALAEKLTEIENEKIEVECRYNQICDECDVKEVSVEQLKESFQKARKLLENGQLSTTKKLIEFYVDRVLIFESRVEVFFNFHPDLTLPELPALAANFNKKEERGDDSKSIGSINESKASDGDIADINRNGGTDCVCVRGDTPLASTKMLSQYRCKSILTSNHA
ncbi:MAG: site-specific recombinase, partial [Clostridiales bacterium]|nr:site-specific recombinase [Clostridiales bacterium]